MPVAIGLDALLASDRLRGRRVGLVCNPASVDGHLRHAADLFAERRDFSSRRCSARSTASTPTCRTT